MDFFKRTKGSLFRRRKQAGPKRLIIAITLLMFTVYILEQNILAQYSENVPDMKLPYLDDGKDKGKIKSRPVVTPVILLGYMRSGSSLTGDILQQNSDVFYVYEPLHDLQKDHFISMEELFPKSLGKHRNPTYQFKEEAVQLFRAWFACDIKYIISDSKRYHLNFFKYGNATKQLADCIEKSSNETNQQSKYCTRSLRTACLKSKFRVIKTIRTRVFWLIELMAEYRELKVVHLVRDPRAVINSWTKFGECVGKYGGVPACAHSLCTNMEDDIASFELLNLIYPTRLQRIAFEELINEPKEVAKSVYNFIGMDFKFATQEYVRLVTNTGNDSAGIKSNTGPNTSSSINSWRSTISDQNLFIVQTLCKHVMDKLGYYHFIKP